MKNESYNICMACMKPLDADSVCPHCGFNNLTAQNYPYLPYKTILGDRYLVGQIIERASDCVTYMGYDINQKAPVTIHEFLPIGISNRIAGNDCALVAPGKIREYQECLNNFLDLWRNLAKMRELSAIISVYDIYEENNTAYAISEYIEHITLRDYLLRFPEGYITWEKARLLFMPVLSTLTALHNNGIIHRGISPISLVLCKDDKLRLTDFSVWQVTTQNSCLQFQDQPGYFAIEQYANDYQQGPWTDIYGFACTLYRALVGNNPIDSKTRANNDKLMIPAKFAEQIPAYVINAMGNALEIFPNDRTRNVERLRAQLSAAPSETVGNTAQYEKLPVPRVAESVGVVPVYENDDENSAVRHDLDQIKKKQKTTTIFSIIAAVIVIIGVGVGVYFAVAGRGDPDIVVSESQMNVAVPNFCLGFTESEIRNSSTYNENFKIEYTMEFSDTEPSGKVFAQSLPAGSQAARGSTITLTVSRGEEMVLLSDYKGLLITEVQDALAKAGFKVVLVTKNNDGAHKPNTIYDQYPAGSKSYKKGTEVVFQVWSEPIVTETETETEPQTTKPASTKPTTSKPTTTATEDTTGDE